MSPVVHPSGTVARCLLGLGDAFAGQGLPPWHRLHSPCNACHANEVGDWEDRDDQRPLVSNNVVLSFVPDLY
ncbi:hypothetical protein Q3G72_033193 [Acer saccharum]|nr:hypothetical protein Q3G72_033193 [Acer saccharum]